MHIRSADHSDLPTLLTFEQNIIAVERTMDPTLIQDQSISYYPLEEHLDALDTEVLVAEIEGQIVGSVFGQIRSRKAFHQTSQMGYIGFMYVKKAQRGQGVSQQLIKAITEWFNQHDIFEIFLQVYAQNPRAIRAYEKIGFENHLIEMRLKPDA